MSDLTNRQRYERRKKERRMWYTIGRRVMYFSFVILSLLITLLILRIPSIISREHLHHIATVLVPIMLQCFFFGFLFALLFSKTGWSKYIFIDFLLNRLSLLVVTIGIALLVNIKLIPHEIRQYGYGIVAVGVVLMLMGRYFQSSPDD